MLRSILFLGLALSIYARPESDPAPGETTPIEETSAFHWNAALAQSSLLLGLQHGGRMIEAKARRELGGPFWSDYFESASNIHFWSDGDAVATNYLAHPLMGAITGYIQVLNDPRGRRLEFDPRSIVGTAMLPMSELEYTGIAEKLASLDKRFAIRNTGDAQPKEDPELVAQH